MKLRIGSRESHLAVIQSQIVMEQIAAAEPGAELELVTMITDGDKILIGLSGGKDSLALVEFLGERMKIFKPRFTLVAARSLRYG